MQARQGAAVNKNVVLDQKSASGEWTGPGLAEYNSARAGWELHQIPPRDSRDAPLQRRIPLLCSTAPNYRMEAVPGQDENENRFHLSRVLKMRLFPLMFQERNTRSTSRKHKKHKILD